MRKPLILSPFLPAVPPPAHQSRRSPPHTHIPAHRSPLPTKHTHYHHTTRLPTHRQSFSPTHPITPPCPPLPITNISSPPHTQHPPSPPPRPTRTPTPPPTHTHNPFTHLERLLEHQRVPFHLALRAPDQRGHGGRRRHEALRLLLLPRGDGRERSGAGSAGGRRVGAKA